MFLLRLPPEILRQVFNQLGSAFFREDLGRITVCKQWFEFALPVTFQYIALSQATLRNLILSGVIEKQPLLKDSLETLDLRLRGYHVQSSTPYSSEHGQGSNSLQAITAAPSNKTSKGKPIKPWIQVLNHDLHQLAIVAQQAPRLRTLRLRTLGTPFPEPLDSSDDYLMQSTIRAFLSIENLRVLVLDLASSFLNTSGQQGANLHICPAIGAILSSLHTLHLRMRTICSDVLKPPNPAGSLPLSVVVVNMSVTSNLSGITSAVHSTRCGGGGVLQLKAELQEQAEALLTQMTVPKIRILTHSLPRFIRQSLDVVTGKTMILESHKAWDDDGESIEDDSGSDSEIEDEDDEYSFYLGV